MLDDVHEPIFAVILVLASGLALASYMLGVLLDPDIAIGLGGLLVGVGAAFLIPEGQRAIGAIMGLLAVGLAGVVIPRLVAESMTFRNEMTVTLALSGLVLLLTIALLRWTVFRPRPLKVS